MIVHEELGRWKVRGFDDGVIGGMVISAPTVLNFGSPALKQKVSSLGLDYCNNCLHNEIFRLFLKSLLVESVSVSPLVNLMLVLMLLVLELLPSVLLMVSTLLSMASRSGSLVVVGPITFPLLFKLKRVSLCFLLNVVKVLKPSLSRLPIPPVLVLLTLHLKMSWCLLKTCWVKRIRASWSSFPTLTTRGKFELFSTIKGYYV